MPGDPIGVTAEPGDPIGVIGLLPRGGKQKGGRPPPHTPHVPPYPMVTRPSATITGTRRSPLEWESIFASSTGSLLTSKYSTRAPFFP